MSSSRRRRKIMDRYIVKMSSEEHGTGEFRYESLNDALDGLRRLAEHVVWLGDGVERWFYIGELSEENEE